MKVKIILILTIFLAALLRLTYLSTDPPSLNWDEASVGYNAYLLLKTGSDEYGHRFPLTIRSFNDYKPAVYTYSVIPAVALFGLNEFSVRLPSALAGIITVIVTFFLVKQLTKSLLLSCLVTELLAVSPWHLQFSRIAFEASLALLFFVTGATLLIKYFNKLRSRYLLFSIFFFVLSAYTHHSVKLIMPLFLFFTAIFCRHLIRSNWRATLMGILFGIILLLPLVRNILRPAGQISRFATVSIFAVPNSFHNQGLPLPILLAKNYFSHLDPRFLFLGLGDNPRHHAPDSGVLLFWSLPFILFGLIRLLQERPKWLVILLIWFALAPLAAIFAIETPHASRSFLYLPIYDIFTAIGITALLPRFRLLLVTLFIFNLAYFFRQYFLVLPSQYAPFWQYGYKQTVQKVLAIENKYPTVYITKAYDQPYIYFLFYGHPDPKKKNPGGFSESFGKYKFGEQFTVPKGSLLVLSGSDYAADINIIDTVNFPDGTVAFHLARRDN